MYKIIGIIAALILGAFAGRIYCRLMNRKSFTIHPILCLICGLIGGGIGSWVVSTFNISDDLKSILFEVVAGVGLACVLFVFLLFVRTKDEEE
jgi:uncharacterized membrane protein YeaQ/YmgE (transglycosylase-associated protein family)